MKKYYVYYYKGFSNCYTLLWADNKEMESKLPHDAVRITRKDAERLCAEENNRKRYDSATAGFGASTILPADYDCFGRDISEDGRYFLNGYIWERSNYVD